MTISDILEHWAIIYTPLSHNPESSHLEDQRFFRIRYIDMENTFKRNSNVIHSPCMLQSVTSTGDLKNAKLAQVSHQVWFLSKIKDSANSLGRYNGLTLENTANELVEICEDLIAYLIELKRTQTCPITKQSYKSDPVLCQELASLDIESLSYGVIPDLYEGQWMIGAVDWRSQKPLFNFSCGAQGKYTIPEENS